MSAVLKPCPFCGSAPHLRDIGTFFVTCPSCGIAGPAGELAGLSYAAEAWNTRAAGGKDADRLLINVSRCEKTFSWDGEKKEYIPKLILEFHPVPMNSPYDAKELVDRNALDAAIAAALRGEVK